MAKRTKKIFQGIRRIVHMLPAAGWCVYLNENDELPLVCWAVIEETGRKRRIVGLILTRDDTIHRLEFVDRVSDFGWYRYRPPSIGGIEEPSPLGQARGGSPSKARPHAPQVGALPFVRQAGKARTKRFNLRHRLRHTDE
jgi:hypothetical protein